MVHPAPGYGEITFVDNCDLVVAGGQSGLVARISRLDGSVSTLVDGLPNQSISGIAY